MKLQAVVLFVILLIAAVGALAFVHRTAAPTIDTIWVINLDKDTERMDNIRAKTQPIADLVHRWPATYGKYEPIQTAINDGVGRVVATRKYEGDGTETQDVVNMNAGAVGCWLSHKRLLQNLASKDLPAHWGHLIVEDDIDFPPHFMAEWELRRHAIPSNWDIVYFGLHTPVGTSVAKDILLAQATADRGNWGTHAYMVRHGALTRILKKLRYMSHEIDVQLNYSFDEFNVYIMDPPLLRINQALAEKSTILIKN